MEESREEVAQLCARLRMDSVRWDRYALARDGMGSERVGRLEWQSRAEISEGRVGAFEEEIAGLMERVKVVEVERDDLEVMLQDLMEQREKDRECRMGVVDPTEQESFDGADSSQTHELLTLAFKHTDVASSYYQSQLSSVSLAYETLLSANQELEERNQFLDQKDQSSRKEIKTAQSRLDAAEKDHLLCADTIIELKIQLELSTSDQRELDGIRQKLEGDVRRLEIKGLEEKAMLKRANDGGKLQRVLLSRKSPGMLRWTIETDAQVEGYLD
jgi:chromosome segregation ATPase